MRTRLAAIVSLTVCILACPRKGTPEATADPPKASASASGVASTAPSVGSAASPEVACLDGVLSGYPTHGLYATDAGAPGDGMGLGAIGGMGGGMGGGQSKSQLARAVVLGTVGKEVTGTRASFIARALCEVTPKIRKCYDDARVANPTAAGKIELGLDIAPTGVITAKINSGALDPAAQECVRAVVASTNIGDAAGSATYALSFQVPLKPVKMIEVGTVVVGRLPPEVVRRIVRGNFPRLRACYEAGLRKDPGLAGKVAVKFVIDTTGAVVTVTEVPGATLTDAVARACVVAVFKTLSFPEPEGGNVNVTYPIEFRSD